MYHKGWLDEARGAHTVRVYVYGMDYVWTAVCGSITNHLQLITCSIRVYSQQQGMIFYFAHAKIMQRTDIYSIVHACMNMIINVHTVCIFLYVCRVFCGQGINCFVQD